MYSTTFLSLRRVISLFIILLISGPLFANSFENKLENKITVNKPDADNPTFSPLAGHAGTIVTITDLAGTFTAIPLSTVTLNGVSISPSNVTFISSTELNVIIPCGFTSGPLAVDGGIPSVLDFQYIAPSVDPLVDQTYCVSETAFPVALSGQPTPATNGVLEFLWSSSNANIGLTNASPLVPVTEIPTFTPLNTTTEPISSIITVTPIINGCTGPITTYTITVNPRPIANAISDIVVCAGELVPPITLTASSPFSGTGTSFVWSGDNNVAIGLGTIGGSTSPIPQFTATNSTGSTITSTFTVIPTFDGCDGTPITFTIDVLPDNFAGTLTFDICSGDTFTQTLTSSIPGTIDWFRAAVPGILEGTSSGIDIINEVLTNTTDTTISVTYDLTLPSGPTCNDTQFIVVNVAPRPSDATVITGGPQLVCAGDTGNIYNTAVIPNATSYVWTLPDGSNVTTLSNSITINYSVTDVSGNLSVHGENSCGIGGESAIYPITVIAQPTLLSSLTPANICSEDIFNYTPVSSAFGASLSWTRAIQPGISNPPGIGNDDISESLINATNATLPVVYTYTITTTEGCVNTQNVTVLVDPLPQLDSPTAPTAVCSGSLFNIPLTSSVAGSISWSRVVFPGIAEASSSGADFINESLTNTTNATISVPYTITLPTSTAGCASPPITIFVNVEPLPLDAVSITSGPQTVCAGSSGNVYITDVIPNATTYEWTLPNGSIVATNFPTITISYALSETSGNLSVRGVNSCGNGGESANYSITIVAPPTLSSSLTPPSVCSGTSFTYFPTSTPAGATYTWTRALQLDISNPAGAGINDINEILYNSTNSPIPVDYEYTITTPEGCQNTETVTVVVDPLPTLTNPPILPSEICSGALFNYTPISNPSGTINWKRNAVADILNPSATGSTTISETLINTSSLPVPVTYELTLPTTTAGCTNIVNIVVVVNPVPSDATTIVSGPQTVCAGSTGNVYNANPIPNATSYLWTLPNGSTNTTTTSQITINYTLSNVSGNLTVQGVNSCGVGAVSASYPITVLAPPILTSPTSLPDICSGDTFTYNPTSSSPNINFSWIRNLQFGIANAPGVGTDGINETLINTTTSPISVEYIYTMTTPTPELCENTETVTVIVNPLPTLISSTAIAPACSGTSFTIPLASSEPGLISWSRNTIPGILEGSSFGLGDITETLTNLTDTTVSVTYEVTLPNTANGCSDVVYITIDIEAVPSDANPILSGPNLVCAGTNGNVYTVGAITNATSYEWTLPNGSTNTTATNSITINYALTDVSGNLSVHGVNSCGIGGESANYPITIIEPPILSSGISPPDVCSEDLFTYTPTSISTNATYSWTRAIQSGISNPAGSGNDDISEILINTTNAPIGVDYVYTINTPDGCENIQTVTVFVNPLPQLTSSTVTTEICSGDTYTYIPASTTDPTTINWTRVPASGILGAASGTGNISDILINSTGLPVLVTYELDLTPTGQGCTDTVTISVIVNPLPIASISGGGSTCLNSTDNLITFTGSNGTAPYTFTYNIDGLGPYFITTSSGNSIAVPSSSSAAGTFVYDLISVQDSSTTSCSNPQTGTASITVNSLPILIITNPIPVCEIDTVDLTDISITAGSDAGLAFSYFTDATATTQYLTPTAATAGTYYIMATNSNGCSVIEPVTVTTNPIPTVTVSNVTVCEGDVATISAIPNPPGAYDYNWTNLPVGVPNPGNVASFTTFIAGDYTVDITNQTLPNCVSSIATGTVTLNPLPDATITGSASSICTDDLATISFTGSLGTVPYTFAYNINGGTTQTVLSAGTTATINVNTNVSGNYNFNLISVTDSSSTACTQLLTGLSYAIEVLPPPNLTISNPAPICAGDTVDLQTTITPFDSGLTYSYWANIGATIALSNPNAVNEGTYFIKATNSAGCSSIAEVVVSALALPTVTVNNETICEGDIATLIATPSITGSYNYNWSVPSGATNPGNVSTFTTSVEGNYSVFITDQNAPFCESSTSVSTVTVNSLPTASISSSEIEVCLNTPVTLTFTGASGTAPYTFEYIDQNGSTQTIVSTLDTATINVPTNASGIYNYSLVSVADSSSTSCSQNQSGTVSITIRDLPIVDAGPSTLDICVGEEITLTATGTATSYTWNNGVIDGVPFTPIITGTYTVTGTDSFGCENTDDIIINVLPAISATITGSYDFTLCEGATPPIITFEGANGTGGYTFYYTISSDLLTTDITGSITTAGNTAVLTPPIPTTTPGEFLVTLDSVDSGSCSNGEILEPSEAFVTVLEAGIVPLNLIEVNQLICEDDPIVDIIFDINGSPTDAFVEGLPTDVTSEYIPSATIGVPGKLTISGIASSSGTFNYTVKTSGAIIGCNSEFVGTIEVNPKGNLSLTIPDSDIQEACINSAITPITYNLEGSANGAAVTFSPYTPTGISWMVSSTTVTISGTPIEAGDFTYTIETFSTTTSCSQAIATGSLTVNSSDITLVSGDPNPILCINNPLINPITYDITNNPNITLGGTLILTGNLPDGITFDSLTGIIDGTPTEAGIFTYNIEASTGCGNTLSGTITVDDTLPNVEIEGGLQEIEVCEGSEITLTGTGADSYEWYLSEDLDASGNPIAPPRSTSETFTVSPTENGSYFVIGSVIGGCTNMSEISVLLKQAISATIEGQNVYEVCKDSEEPTITFKAINGIAPYTFTYSIGTIINTVASPVSSDTVTINIPTNVAGTYNIELINVEDSGSLYCSPIQLLQPTSAVVTIVDSGVYPQAGTAIYQTLCEGDLMSPITFDITGDATNAFAEGLPSGVTSSFVGNVLTISGTPTVSFDYTVVTSGLSTECNSSFTASITVDENDTLTLISPQSTDAQEICACTSIEPILYELGGGATGATVTGLPLGINWSIVNNIITIEGNSCDTPNNYTYTITTQGICGSTTIDGMITIIDPDALQLTIGEADTTVCVNTALVSNIQYQSTPGQTLILTGALPPGVSFSSDVVTGSAVIQGTPTLSGVYSYSISTGNDCSTELSGTITVEDGAFINYLSGELSQIACLNSAIEPIRFSVPNSLQDITFSPELPPGISYLIVDGELIISGTPTALTGNPNIITLSTSIICNDFATTEIELIIQEVPTITLESNSGLVTQSVCQNNEIDPIVFTVSPIGTVIDETLLPNFINVNFDSVTGTYVLTGAPISTGSFNFQIQTLTNTNCSAEINVSIENLYAAVSIELASGSENQTLCSFTDPIEDIVYNIDGILPSTNVISVTGLPSGISATQITSSTGVILTLSGQPSESGIFEYEIIYDNCGTLKTGILEISSPMSINAEVTQTTCNGTDGKISVVIFGGVPYIDENGNPFYAITWEGPNGFRQNQTTITGLNPGDYTLSGFDSIGCALPSQTFTINPVSPLIVTLLNTTSINCNEVCNNFDFTGGSEIYTEFLLESVNQQSQLWTPIIPDNNNYYNICDLNTGMYRLSVTDSNGCASAPYVFTVESNGELSIENIILDENICNGTQGSIYVEVNSVDPNLNFYYNEVLVSSENLGDNIYELMMNESSLNGILRVTNSQGCSDEEILSTQTVDDFDFEFTSLDFLSSGYIGVNSSIEFTNLSIIGNPAEYNYVVWDFDDNTPFRVFYNPEDLAYNADGENIETVFHTYTNDGIYDVTLTVYNNTGCSKSVTKTIIVGKGATIILPTVFSPNYDGINDFFGPSFNGLKEITMYIYDSWGNLVYEASNNDISSENNLGELRWNGIEPINSEPRNGSYRCYIIAKTLDDKKVEKTGRFLIVQ